MDVAISEIVAIATADIRLFHFFLLALQLSVTFATIAKKANKLFCCSFLTDFFFILYFKLRVDWMINYHIHFHCVFFFQRECTCYFVHLFVFFFRCIVSCSNTCNIIFVMCMRSWFLRIALIHMEEMHRIHSDLFFMMLDISVNKEWNFIAFPFPHTLWAKIKYWNW